MKNFLFWSVRSNAEVLEKNMHPDNIKYNMQETLAEENTLRYHHVSVVIPTYHEVENIHLVLTGVIETLECLPYQYDIIVVDDDSRDGSDQLVREISDSGFPVRLITRKKERGLSSAVLRGFNASSGDLLVCMDADLSHPPEAIARMLEQFEQSPAQFVIGSRYVAGATTDDAWGVFRFINSWFATLLARPFTRVKDPMSGYFMIPKEIFMKANNLNPVGYKVGLELMVKCNCQEIREIPIHFAQRKFGESKLNLREQWNYIRHIKRLMAYKLSLR